MTNNVPAGPLGEAPMSDELDLAESVAGEEDPGASIDIAEAAVQRGKPDAPAGQQGSRPADSEPSRNPADEAPARRGGG